MKFHETSEKIVEILCHKTQNYNPEFFRILVAYHLTKMPAMMRVKVRSKDRKTVPINMYAINLASSGQGKGYATGILEDHIMQKFRTHFTEQTCPSVSDASLQQLAAKRAYLLGEEEPDDTLEAVRKEYKEAGELAFAFDSATTAAVKQLRHKMLMAKIGSMNLEIDEIGSNLLGNTEVLGTMLETFDMGKLKSKLTKNTKENTRSAEIIGNVPANLLLFGTPSKLLNGSKTEDEFYSFLDTGYARRPFFGFSTKPVKRIDLTPKEIFDIRCDDAQNTFLAELSDKFAQLADEQHYNKVITMSEDMSLLLIEYEKQCLEKAATLNSHKELQITEMTHRYFKVMKLAGAYAFIDGKAAISADHLYAAMKLAEASGEAFAKIIHRDKAYVKLAKYMASVDHELTHVDLAEELPFYKGSAQVKSELMQYAIAWGYKNQIIIKKSFSNGIEFLRGEALKKTDISNLRLSLSEDMAINYKNVEQPFDRLFKFFQHPSYNWINHWLENGHRHSDNIIPGFNMVVIDVDGGTQLSTAKLLLRDYMCLFYTTKSSTPEANRFRIVLPIKYFMELDAEEHCQFMKNIYAWLPFAVDTATHDRPRKWSTCKGEYAYSEGTEMLDPMMFIPKTAKNDERHQRVLDTQSLSNLERWFVQNTADGNRSSQFIRYALILVDGGADADTVRDAVLELNKKLPEKLDTSEIDSTIMVTVAKAITKRDNA
jgi:hypothetical protein